MPTRGKRGRYLGFVAHEIKNPLATALWSCDLLKRMEGADRTGERATKMVDVSVRALRRMRRLIDDYFTIERLLEQGYELKDEKLPLRDLVDSTMRTLAEKDGIAVDGWVVEVGQGDVTGDADMLKRAIRYALEHMARPSSKARLTIASRPAAAQQELHIRAEEPPVPLIPGDPEDRPSGDPTGAVLGFELAARILEAHGGRIEERDGGLSLFLPNA
jgi:signal transduction histidine kinase